MNLVALALAGATSFLLVFARIAGFVAASPFPGNHVPEKQRVGLVFVLTLVASSFVVPDVRYRSLDLHLMGAGVLEGVVGIIMGLSFRMILVVGDVLGAVLAQAIGLSTPSVLNPTLEQQDSVLGRIVALFALLLALQLGVHRVAFGYLLESFRVLPLADAGNLPNVTHFFVDWAGEAIALGLRLAMPVVAVSFVIQMGLAMIARAAPALQIFSVGLTVVVGSGMLTLIASLESVAAGLASHFGHMGTYMEAVISALGQVP